jgi:hypothetical protein
MHFGGRAWDVVVSGILLLMAGPAFADSSSRVDERFPPDNVPPIDAPTDAPTDAGKRTAPATLFVSADARVESIELGFDRGTAPARGRAVTWQGGRYRVIGVSARDGSPTFSAGSRHVIGVEGSRLMVALKFIDPDGTIGVGTPIAALNGK